MSSTVRTSLRRARASAVVLTLCTCGVEKCVPVMSSALACARNSSATSSSVTAMSAQFSR